MESTIIDKKFIVQEKHRGVVRNNPWFDDPDQPKETMDDLLTALKWLQKDCMESLGHNTVSQHRIIERSESVIYTPKEIDVLLELLTEIK